MNAAASNDMADERSLVRLYMDLTGAQETVARSVFMHVCGAHEALLPVREAGITQLAEEPPSSVVMRESVKAGWLGKAMASPVPG
ncbi:MAG TPA: hypothetical protein VN794_10785 [Methylomirabilota bacterium]|jgi:hypothetical protein|nr:hypothetical protein [Methylomirabilota bacterium]